MFVSEFQRLESDGFNLNGITLKLKISKLICDAPAKSYVLCVKSHTGYFGCTKCVQEGEYVNGRVIFPETTATLRTDASFRKKVDEDYHKGTTPLEQLTMDLVSQIPLDYMHLVCLGVMKRLLLFWVRGNKSVRLTEENLSKIEKKIQNFKAFVPKEFSRLPRSLQKVENFKATELRQFLLYIGPIILKNNMSKIYYAHFMSLHVAIRILCTENLYVIQ